MDDSLFNFSNTGEQNERKREKEARENAFKESFDLIENSLCDVFDRISESNYYQKDTFDFLKQNAFDMLEFFEEKEDEVLAENFIAYMEDFASMFEQRPENDAVMDHLLNDWMMQQGTMRVGKGWLSATHEHRGNRPKGGQTEVDLLGNVGKDWKGGLSLGPWQIAVNPGTYGEYLDHLKKDKSSEAKIILKRLKEQGNPIGQGTRGPIANEWKKISKDPLLRETFFKTQKAYIFKHHYIEAVKNIQKKTEIKVDDLSLTTQEVIWSSAVQHGGSGGADVVIKAIESGFENEMELIDKIYKTRISKYPDEKNRYLGDPNSPYPGEREDALNYYKEEAVKSNLHPIEAHYRATHPPMPPFGPNPDIVRSEDTGEITPFFLSKESDVNIALFSYYHDGVIANSSKIPTFAEFIIQTISQYFPQSDAQKGPMVDISRSGKSFVTTFADGIRLGKAELTTVFEEAMGLIVPDTEKEGVKIGSIAEQKANEILNSEKKIPEIYLQKGTRETEPETITRQSIKITAKDIDEGIGKLKVKLITLMSAVENSGGKNIEFRQSV